MLPKPGSEADSLRFYCNAISSSRPLSRQVKIDLCARIKQGDIETRNELVQANLRFAVSITQTYRNCGFL